MPLLPILFESKDDVFQWRPVGKPILTESADGGRSLSISGVFQNWKVRNANRRVYPKPIWERLFKEDSDFVKRLKGRRMVGMLEHPEDGITRLDKGISHLVTDVHFATDQEISESRRTNPDEPLEEGDILGTFEVLDTRDGKELRAMIEGGVRFGVSSRGGGTLKEDAEGFEVNDDFDCETWDAVATPSVARALPNRTEQSKPAAVAEGVANDPEFTRMATAIRHAEKTGNEDELTNGRRQLLQWCTSKGINAKQDPNVLDLLESEVPAPVPAPAPEPTPAPNESPVAESVPTPVSKPQPKTNITESKMTPIQRLKGLELDIVRLKATPTKGLKPSQMSSIFESITTSQVEIQRVLVEDPTLKPYGDKLTKTLVEFEDSLDAEPIDDAPPAPPAGGDAPPADAEGSETADVETLNAAADKLDQCCGDDEEAKQLVDDLRALADSFDTDVTPDAGAGDAAPTFESFRRLKKRFLRLESDHSKLAAATAKLLERNKALQETISTRPAKSGEEGQLTEYKTAAAELANRYNRDMVEFGLVTLQDKRPALFEKHGKSLAKCKTWSKFTETVARLVAESTEAPTRRSVKESAPKAPAAPAAAPAPAKAPVLAESHPSVRMVGNARRDAK